MATLYIAEDSEMDQRIIKFTLAKFDLFTGVLFFNDGYSLLNHLKCNSRNSFNLPDIIFLDLWMPVLDGWDFLEAFNTLYHTFSKSIQIYIVSVSIHPADVKRALAYEFVKDFISKPITKEKLIAISEYVLI